MDNNGGENGGAAEDGAGGALDLVGGADAGAGGGNGGGAEGGGEQNGGGEGEGGGGPDGDGASFLELLSAEGGDSDNPSNRDWAKSAGLKDLDHTVKLLRDNMKAARAGGKLTVPGDDAKPEDIAAFRTAIGVPENAAGYEIKGPEGVPLNTDLIGKLSDAAVAHGVPKGAFQGIVGEFIKLQMDEAATADTNQKAEGQAWLKEQGAAATEKMAHIDKAAAALGFTKTDMTGFKNAIGPKRTLDLLAKLGEGMAEDVLINGGKGKFGVTGAEAQAEINRLKADPEFVKAVRIKGSPQQARWNRLTDAAAEHDARQQAA